MKILNLFWLLLFVFIFESCVQNLNPQINNSVGIAVNCILTKSDYQKVKIFYGSSISSSEFNCPDDAKVVITDLTGKVSFKGIKTSYGEWTVAFMPNFGHNYKLEVEVDGKKLHATTSFPKSSVGDYKVYYYKEVNKYNPSNFSYLPANQVATILLIKDWIKAYEDDIIIWIKRSEDYSLKIFMPENDMAVDYINQSLVRFKLPYYFAIDDYSFGVINNRNQHMYFYNVSISLDYYLKDIYKKQNSSSDLVTLLYSDAHNSYTNVIGGFGIFGAVEAFKITMPFVYNYGTNNFNTYSFIPQ